MKSNVLFVSLSFPPKSCPESLQAAKYFHYMKDKVGKMQVVTAACPSLFMPYDKSLEKYYPDNIPVTELKVFESKYANYLIRKAFPALLEMPDYKALFTLKTKKILKNLQIKPDVIYSRSFPVSSAFIAYKLKKKLNIPWVFHLSDPWTISPIEFRTNYSQRFNEKKEAEFFSVADYITFTSDETIRQYSLKYPEFEKKFRFFPNVFDPADIINMPTKKNNDKLLFTYTGGLANTRTHEPVLKALRLLFDDNPQLFDNVKFSFAGQFDRKNQNLFSKYSLPFVENLGLLPNTEANELIRNSDVLMLLDTYFEKNEQAMFLPSKLLDYAITGKNILAVTNKNSTTFNIVNNRLGSCFEHHDIRGIKQYIYQKISDIKNNNSQTIVNLDKNFLNKYSADKNATRLADLLNSLKVN